jgi:hypothetical protein
MPDLDLFIYRDFDSLDVEIDVYDNAAEKLGIEFKGLHVVALGPPIHEGKDKTVVLASEHRPDRMQEIKRFFAGRGDETDVS